MISTYEDFLTFMSKQAIYVSDIPLKTYAPENGHDWSINDSGDSEEIKAVINGPLCPKDYFNSTFRILYFLREPYYNQDDWNDGWRGGENQCTTYGAKNYKDITNHTYKHLIEFVFYLNRMINEKNNHPASFKDLSIQEEAMQAARSHLCILNACWFPHIGSSSNINNCINWLLKNEDFFEQCTAIFAPTLIIGAGVIKPQWKEDLGCYKLFNKIRQGYLTPKDLSQYNIDPFSNNKDHTFLIDNKLYINTFHPQNFDAYTTAKSISSLHALHQSNKLLWNK